MRRWGSGSILGGTCGYHVRHLRCARTIGRPPDLSALSCQYIDVLRLRCSASATAPVLLRQRAPLILIFPWRRLEFSLARRMAFKRAEREFQGVLAKSVQSAEESREDPSSVSRYRPRATSLIPAEGNGVPAMESSALASEKEKARPSCKSPHKRKKKH